MIQLLAITFLGLFVAGVLTGHSGVAIMSLIVLMLFMWFIELLDRRLAAQAKQREQDMTPPDSESALDLHSTDAGRTHL